MRKIKINYFWIVVITLMIGFYVSVLGNLNQPSFSYELSNQDKRMIVDRIGFTGYRKSIDLRCDKPLVNYIKTGKWVDSWCAKRYSHVKR